MMLGANISQIKQLATFLNQQKICKDVSPIERAISKLSSGTFVVERLQLNFMKKDLKTNETDINLPRNTSPILVDWDIILDVSIPAVTSPESSLDLKSYYFRFKIEGVDENAAYYADSWHLDFDNSDSAEYVHPWFHLTHGGDLIKDLKHGQLLSIIAPRIAYPPMDFVLGIDFLLSNFMKKKDYLQIQADSQYKRTVAAAQEWLLKPYIMSIAHKWCNFNCGNYADLPAFGKHYLPNLQKTLD